MTIQIPAHLPARLTISLWDFSWYTMTTPGEPFHDLDRAFEEAVARGYNTVRICAMPYLLFGPGGEARGPLHFTNLGGDFGQRTRWYNAVGGATIDGREHLLRLFRAARQHQCFIILSSWEYQQSPSFLADPSWYNELTEIPPRQRFAAIAAAMARLIQCLKDHDLADRIAYAELHNEVNVTKLREIAGPGQDVFAAEQPYIEEAVASLRAAHPDILMTTCYVNPVSYRMRDLAQNVQVAHFHLYVYGVLGALFQAGGLRSQSGPFPTEVGQAILRRDAPPFDTWQPPGSQEWRLDATGVSRRLFYMHDWTDPVKWDLWLYDHYGAYRQSMREAVAQQLEAMADWASQRGIPAVIGEGYVGYTPLLATFEEGPVGKDIAEYAVETCLRLDYWGIILCSNAAPHHPMWADTSWQQAWNRRILTASPT